MFTSGQKIFALVFIVVFVILIGYQFYKDRKRDTELFKGAYWVVLAVISVMIGYVLLNKLLH